jgi:hypothetical protein
MCDVIKDIVSIDIGIKTLTIYRERFNCTQAERIPKINKCRRYNADATSTEDYKKYIRSVAQCGTVVFLDKKDISNNNNARFVDNIVLLNLVEYLEDLNKKGVFNGVGTIVIERQMRTNPNAQIIEHHIHNYFLVLFRTFKQIINFQSKYKTRVLGAPLKCIDKKTNRLRKVKKHERKKWSTEIAEEILKLREDTDTHHFIFKTHKSKKDDLSDTIVQCLAYNLMQLN